MPLFEYECRNCKTRFELLVFDRGAEVVCRNCGSKEIVRLLSTFAVGAGPSRQAAQEDRCAGCQGRQGGICPMNQQAAGVD